MTDLSREPRRLGIPVADWWRLVPAARARPGRRPRPAAVAVPRIVLQVVGSGAGRLRLARRGARRASGTRTVARQPHKLNHSRRYAQRRFVHTRTFIGTPATESSGAAQTFVATAMRLLLTLLVVVAAWRFALRGIVGALLIVIAVLVLAKGRTLRRDPED